MRREESDWLQGRGRRRWGLRVSMNDRESTRADQRNYLKRSCPFHELHRARKRGARIVEN